MDTEPASNNHNLQTLIDLASKQGGMVLRVGNESKAVVLSIEKYNELLAKQQASVPEPPKTVLVTGGAGYIGSHTVKRLLEAGHRVVVLDDLSTGRREFVPPEADFYQGDVGDRRLLEQIFSAHQADAVTHFAASLEVNESVEKPAEYFDNNVSRTIILLRAMNDAGVRQINFSSTAAVYGDQEKMPIDESAPPRPNNPYGMNKLLAEHIIRYFAEFLGMRATVLRYFNVCGAEPGGNLGDTHTNSHLIPIVLGVAKGLRDRLVINGNDYDTFDGTCVRDYVHVQDIAEAHTLALQHPEGADNFRVYNVGTGKGYSVEQVVSAAAEVLGKMIPIEIGPRRAGDAAATVAGTKKIQAELGFMARYSDLENIINTSWNRLQKAS